MLRRVRQPMDVARLEEGRLALALSELAEAHLPLASGGSACAGGAPESWLNRVVGLGMSAAASEDELDAMDDFYAARGFVPEIELCPFADRGVAPSLAARGYRLQGFEAVLFRDLAAPLSPDPSEDAVAYEPLDLADEAALGVFLDVHVACFVEDGPPGSRRALSMREDALRMVRHPRVRAWVIRAGGEVVGCGGLEVYGEVATLLAACVLPPYRRRGIQRGFISRRCREARAAGCTVATISSAPESPTLRNVIRAGFLTAYTKARLRPGTVR